MLNGILVFTESDKLETAFYTKLCTGKLKLIPVRDIASSYLTVYDAIRKNQAKPNVFVVHKENEHYFNWECYKNSRCFTLHKTPISFYKINETPSLFHYLSKDRDIFKKAFSINKDVDISIFCDNVIRNSCRLSMSYDEIVNLIDLNVVISNVDEFSDLLHVLNLPIL